MVTVTRTYSTPVGYPARGTVRFTPTTPMVNGVTTIAAPVEEALDHSGNLSITVAANSDPATLPVGASYDVQETLTGQATRTYRVVIPHNQGSTVSLSALEQLPMPPPPSPTDVWTAALAGKQPLDDDLTAIAGLGAANNDLLQRKSGAWTNRTPAQVKTDLAVGAADLTATGTRDGTKFLRDDNTWQIGSGGGGAVSSVNGQTGAVVLTPDSFTDGTTNHVFTAADDTKLGGIATGATANSSDATLLARANHTGTQSADTLTDGTSNKAFTAAERTKLAGIATGATAGIPASTVTTKGDLIAATANAAVTRLAVGADGRLLTADSAAAAGLSWSSLTIADITQHIDALDGVSSIGNAGTSLAVTPGGGNGCVKLITLNAANCTITFNAPAFSGRAYTLEFVITQDATGGRTITWPTSVKWAGGSAPTLSTAANAVDRVVFTTYNTANTLWYGDLIGKGYA
jgi:hypothetical protein